MGLLLALGAPCIVWGVIGGVRDAINARRAARDLPIAARELGLRTRPTRHLPELHGAVDGFEVAVRDAAIEITLPGGSALRAHHTSYELPPPHAWMMALIVRALRGGDPIPEFAFGDPVLDRFFPARTSPARTNADAAAADPALRSALRRLVDRHGRFSSLVIGDTIRCEPMVGHSGPPKSHSISGAQVRALLPGLLEVARALRAASPPGR